MWTEKLYWKSIISQVLNGWKINGWLGGGYADLVPFDGFGVWVIGVVNGGGGSMLNTCPNPDWPEWSEAGRSSQGCRHQGVCSVSLSFFVRGLHMWILQMHSKTTGGIPPTGKSHMKRHLAVCFPDRCFFFSQPYYWLHCPLLPKLCLYRRVGQVTGVAVCISSLVSAS